MTPTTDRFETVRAFANTLDVEDVEHPDHIDTVAELGDWLTAHGLLDGGVSRLDEADVSLARRTRDAIRALMHGTHAGSEEESVGGDGEETTLDDLAEAVAASGLHPRFTASGVTLQPSVGGVAGAMGELLAAVAEAMADGSWQRFKICANDECQWAFVDQSRNRSARWCDMAVCGNRAKVRAYRARHDA